MGPSEIRNSSSVRGTKRRLTHKGVLRRQEEDNWGRRSRNGAGREEDLQKGRKEGFRENLSKGIRGGGRHRLES